MDKRLTLSSVVVILIITFFISSCATTKRNLVYFSNLPDSVIYNQQIKNQVEAKIQPGDVLAIKITTLNPETNILLNSGSLPMQNLTTGIASSANTGSKASSEMNDGYLVNGEGEINFPMLGKIKVADKTIEMAESYLTELLSKTNKGTIVNISIQNFKITVIGEVLRPGSFTIPNDKLNVLEALGMAGDMTPYSVRENVLVIREENGVRSMKRLDLTDKSVFESPFFYLRQNDVVYVQPENKLKAQQANANSYRWIPILTAAISALAIVLSRVL